VTFSAQLLSIENFRAVKGKVQIDFSKYQPGLYFVAGENKVAPRLGSNGSGKSTCFSESICWVLTGKISRSNRPGSEVENWDAEGFTKVEFIFDLYNKSHSVTRTRKPNGIILDGEKVEQEVVDKLLPLSDSALRKTIFIDQFSSMFLSLRAEEKSRIFSETLGLDRWIKAADNSSAKLKQTENKSIALEREIQAISAAMAEIKDQFEMARKKEEEFDTDLEKEIASKRTKITELKQKVDEYELKLNEARVELSKYGLTNSKVEENELRIKERKVIADRLTAEALLKSLGREKTSLQERLFAYQNDDLCPECGQPIGCVEAAQKANELNTKIDDISDRIADIGEQISKHLINESSIRNNLSELSKKLTAYNEVQNALSQTITKNQLWLSSYHDATKALKELKNKINPFISMCDDLQERYETNKTKRAKLKQELSTLNEQSEIYKFWVKGFRDIRLEQIDSTLLELEIAANRHSQALGLEDWEVEFATERETVAGSLSHKFSVLLYPPDRNEPIPWESYSGGESHRWQLAITMALSEVLLSRAGMSTDIEVWDEPSTHLSPEGIDDLLTCLKDRAKELNRRIYLIDHNSLDKGSFDGVITVIKTIMGVEIVE
jgi:exonuclease SbcC